MNESSMLTQLSNETNSNIFQQIPTPQQLKQNKLNFEIQQVEFQNQIQSMKKIKQAMLLSKNKEIRGQGSSVIGDQVTGKVVKGSENISYYQRMKQKNINKSYNFRNRISGSLNTKQQKLHNFNRKLNYSSLNFMQSSSIASQMP